jgi:hypothetical protein
MPLFRPGYNAINRRLVFLEACNAVPCEGVSETQSALYLSVLETDKYIFNEVMVLLK